MSHSFVTPLQNFIEINTGNGISVLMMLGGPRHPPLRTPPAHAGRHSGHAPAPGPLRSRQGPPRGARGRPATPARARSRARRRPPAVASEARRRPAARPTGGTCSDCGTAEAVPALSAAGAAERTASSGRAAGHTELLRAAGVPYRHGGAQLFLRVPEETEISHPWGYGLVPL